MFIIFFISVELLKKVNIPEEVNSIVLLLATEELLHFCIHVVSLPFSKYDIISVYSSLM